jgi:hypothetical protein
MLLELEGVALGIVIACMPMNPLGPTTVLAGVGMTNIGVGTGSGIALLATVRFAGFGTIVTIGIGFVPVAEPGVIGGVGLGAVSVIAEIVLAVDVLIVDVLLSVVETTVLLAIGVETAIELGVDDTTVFLAIGLVVVGVLVDGTIVSLAIGLVVVGVVLLGAETTVFLSVGATVEVLFGCTWLTFVGPDNGTAGVTFDVL